MKQKLLGIGVLIATLCLMTACSTGGGAGSATGSQPDSITSSSAASSSAPADQSAAPQETQPASSADASGTADGSTPDASLAEPETPDSSADGQTSENSQGKPMLTGSFAEGANPTSLGDPNEDSYIQSMEVEGAAIVLGRFSTNHSTEAYLDEYYNPNEFEVTEQVTVSGNSGTHYRWKTGGEESAVVDAVVVEADGYSLLFLSRVPQDVYEGLSSSQPGPTQETVESWIAGLAVSNH